MKITEENLKNLKQLDRIEFRQRYQILQENKPEIGAPDFLFKMSGIMGFVFLTGLIIMLINKEAGATILSILPPLVGVSFIVFFALIFLTIAFEFIQYKLYKKLIGEYFKEEIKVKK